MSFDEENINTDKRNYQDNNENQDMKHIELKNIIDEIAKGKEADEDKIEKLIREYILYLIHIYEIDNYEVIFLMDEKKSITDWHANKIYQAVKDKDEKKDILLILQSNGGSIEPAYLISKTCKKSVKTKKFAVAVPRKAKSAATLLALGAEEIHMGLMSELGPIDPQINGYPALGMKNAVSMLANLCCCHPQASDMISKYLIGKLEISTLGYCNRISESAVQYAIRLLPHNKFPDKDSKSDLAEHFVNHYKDHRFVIDSHEATDLLGEEIIKQDSNEYLFANAVHKTLNLTSLFTELELNKYLSFVGNITDGIELNFTR